MDICKILDVATFINDHIGDNIKNIGNVKELVKKLDESINVLHDKISGAPATDSSELNHLLYTADKDLKRARLLITEKDELTNDVTSHLSSTENQVQELVPSVHQITQLEKHQKYLQWLQLVNKLGKEMKSRLESSDSKRRIVNSFVTLTTMCKCVQSSACANLRNYVTETTHFWFKVLKERFGKEFDDVLKQLKWPFIPCAPGVYPTPPYDVLCQFETLFGLLIDIELPCELVSRENSESINIEPLLLPMQFLLNPFRKRFLYHFTGNKKTNDIHKPEWYLTNCSNWIRDHVDFIDTYVQPILNRAGYSRIIAKVGFMSGLIELVTAKMTNDMPKLMSDDGILAHTINEVWIFEKELRSRGYPLGRPSCVQVLTGDNCLGRWLNIEKKLAQDNLDQMLSSESAWTIEYQDQNEETSNKVPQCAEKFITMIMGITERYKTLPLPGHRLKFLELQLEIIDDFRLRLVQLLEHKEPISSLFVAILNVIYYVTYVLKDWCETPFFLQMQYYRQQFVVMQKSLMERSQSSTGLLSQTQMSSGETLHTSFSSISKEVLESIHEIESETGIIETLEETVFEDSVELFDHMKEEMFSKLSDSVLMEVKAKSYAYRHEKWFSIPPLKACIQLSISPTVCPMLMVLSTSLNLLQRELALPLFTVVWQRLTQNLSDFIFEELILRNRFSEGGATQLAFDMNRNLFPLFAEYTRKPENHFRKIKEACLLLNLNKGSALLLKDVLISGNEEQLMPKSTADPNLALEELGIHRLKLNSALTILNLRLDLE